METEPKEQPKQEVTIVKKGLFYYLFQLLSLPFKILFFLLKIAKKYIGIYVGWIKEDIMYKKKQKALNKFLNVKKVDAEVL